jgi:hypothetical protein
MDSNELFKKEIHTQIRDYFRTLKYPGTDDLVFGQVEKMFVNIPTKVPACEIAVDGTAPQILGNDYDERGYAFNAIITDDIESTISQSDADSRIDRFSNIEDVVLNALQKVPNIFEDGANGIRVSRIIPMETTPSYELTNAGIRIYMSIKFVLYILISVKQM